jgi:uncharacterized membrane protein
MRTVCTTKFPADRRIAKAAIAGGIFLGLLVLFFVPPAALPVPVCAFHSITGHSCLTCGMTRAIHTMLHGNLADSVRYHLFGPAVLLGLLLCMGVFVTEAASGKRVVLLPEGRARNRTIGVSAILLLIYWGVRLVAEFAA